MLNLKVILKFMFTHAVIASNMERMKTIRTGMTVSWLNMKRYPNRVLNIVPIASYSTKSKEKCGSVCLKTPACKSLNLKQESASQYHCELLDTDMFEMNCNFIWDEVISHYEFVSNCTKYPGICGDPSKICVANITSLSSYKCEQKRNIQVDQKHFCPTGSYPDKVSTVVWEFPHCGHCRSDGSVYIMWHTGLWNYNRTWEDYKNGFGKLGANSDYWIGLEMLHQITNPPVKLIVNCEGTWYAPTKSKYENFSVLSEKEFYKLNVNEPQQSIFVRDHSGKQFSTFDRGNNQKEARLSGTGWWYGDAEGVNWFKGKFPTWDSQSLYIYWKRCRSLKISIKRYV